MSMFVYLGQEEWYPVLVPEDSRYADYCVPGDMPELVTYLQALEDFKAKQQAFYGLVVGSHSIYRETFIKGKKTFLLDPKTES